MPVLVSFTDTPPTPIPSYFMLHISYSIRRETHSAVEQWFHSNTIDRTTDMPDYFKGSEEREKKKGGDQGTTIYEQKSNKLNMLIVFACI